MATKSKPKPKTKTSAKRTKGTKPRAKSKTPATEIPNHRFEPGAMVGFFPVSDVGMERAIGREPIPAPAKTAKVGKDGGLKVSGLGKGVWCAAAQDGERWRYFQFSVK